VLQGRAPPGPAVAKWRPTAQACMAGPGVGTSQAQGNMDRHQEGARQHWGSRARQVAGSRARQVGRTCPVMQSRWLLLRPCCACRVMTRLNRFAPFCVDLAQAPDGC
jgi:hypothetical protein